MDKGYLITEIKKLAKGKYEVSLEGGEPLILYGKELSAFHIKEDGILADATYQQILEEVLNKRATKRAMHLLEKQDRTESNLRDKLRENGYPKSCIEAAIAYVKRFHYVDDYRFAENYISFHQGKESKRVLKQKLMQKGVPSQVIEEALEETYQANEVELICDLLRKRKYSSDADMKEKQKTYAFLMRKGFSSSAIRSAMNLTEE